MFWTAPLPAWPVDPLRFGSLTYLATTPAALYVLSLGNWDGARFLRVLLARCAGASHPARDAADCVLYAYLSVFYLPAVADACFRQSRQAQLTPQARGA
jgi:hypothetical protein